MNVAIFTDNDFDKVNGVTTTFRAALQSAPAGIRSACLHCGVVAGRDRLLSGPAIHRRADPVLLGDADLSPAFLGVPQACTSRSHRPGASDDTWSDRPRRRFTSPGGSELPLIGSFHTDLAAYATLLSGSSRLGALMREYMRWPVRPMCSCPRALGAHASVADLGEVERGSDRRVATRGGHDRCSHRRGVRRRCARSGTSRIDVPRCCMSVASRGRRVSCSFRRSPIACTSSGSNTDALWSAMVRCSRRCATHCSKRCSRVRCPGSPLPRRLASTVCFVVSEHDGHGQATSF